MKNYFERISLYVLFLFIPLQTLSGYEKVVIWGHKLHTHTHSYIHQGFYDAFKRLGYQTYWFDNDDDVSTFDFANALFLTEGGVDNNIPLRSDCQYLLHNTTSTKYQPYQFANFQVYTDDVLTRSGLLKIEPCIYYDINGKCIYMPWATDLFPEEIDEMKKKVPFARQHHIVHWIGSLGNHGTYGNMSALTPFIVACLENGFQFIAPNPWGRGIDHEEHIRLIQSSYMAPAIVGEWQREIGYIPCRIFKNISYGQMGITNSKRVYELFDGKIVYNPDTNQLFYDALRRIANSKPEEQWELMDIVKNKHTYLNRAETLLHFLKLVYGE